MGVRGGGFGMFNSIIDLLMLLIALKIGLTKSIILIKLFLLVPQEYLHMVFQLGALCCIKLGAHGCVHLIDMHCWF